MCDTSTLLWEDGRTSTVDVEWLTVVCWNANYWLFIDVPPLSRRTAGELARRNTAGYALSVLRHNKGLEQCASLYSGAPIKRWEAWRFRPWVYWDFRLIWAFELSEILLYLIHHSVFPHGTEGTIASHAFVADNINSLA